MRYGLGPRRGGAFRNKGRWWVVCLCVLESAFSHRAFGTASSQIWNPSADVQKKGTVHFGIDNYFSVFGNDTKSFQILPDIGVTAGVTDFLEIGLDMVQPSADPFYFNFKLGIPESGPWPAVAIGGCNIGTRRNVTDYNMLYGIAAKTLPFVGRLSAGAYRGMNGALFPDSKGNKSDSGIIASWDKALCGRLWACVDYASGDSWYGSLSLGGSYSFGPDASVVFGYVFFNNKPDVVPNNAFTAQLDITLSFHHTRKE